MELTCLAGRTRSQSACVNGRGRTEWAARRLAFALPRFGVEKRISSRDGCHTEDETYSRTLLAE